MQPNIRYFFNEPNFYFMLLDISDKILPAKLIFQMTDIRFYILLVRWIQFFVDIHTHFFLQNKTMTKNSLFSCMFF